MTYIIALTATLLGVAGVVMTRRNQFNLLTTTAQVLIWLIVVTGIAMLVVLAYKDDAVRAANRHAQLVEARLQSLGSKPFDLARVPSAAHFLIEAEDSGAPLKLLNFSGPFPSYGRRGRIGRIGVALPNVFAVYADIAVQADDTVEFTHVDGEGRPLREGESGAWFRPGPSLPFAHGAELRPQLALAKILAAIKAHGADPLGRLELDIPNNPQTRTYVSVNLERIYPAFRFKIRQETSFEPCTAVITVPMRFELDPPQSATRMEFTLRLIEREQMAVVCEKATP